MESFLGRYRNLVILMGVLFLQLLGLAVQVKRSESENTRVIRIWAVDAIAPFERALVSVQNSCGSVWHNYVYLRGVRAENRELKEQIGQMRLEQVRLSQDAEQARRLQTLLSFKEQMIAKTVAAQVIGSSGSDLSRILYLDKGENDGLKPDMAVVTADGIVGKILLVTSSVSQVLLINDQSSGVGVILEKSRLQGVLRGTANGEIVLERVMSDEQVAPGDRVLSSGGDQIFPKGMPVGTVSKVSPGKDLFLNIKVKPAANLSRLEEVLVVSEKPEREAVAENGGKVRAADILAQRLPSVPDQPATAADASGKTATRAGSGTGDIPRVVSSDGPMAAPKSAVEKTGSSSDAGANGGAAAASQAAASQFSASQTKAASPAVKTGGPPKTATSQHSIPKPTVPKPAGSTTQTATPLPDGPH